MDRPGVGVQQVPCIVCRAAVGRPCKNRRGYLVRAHQPRVTDWVAYERAEVERSAAPAR